MVRIATLVLFAAFGNALFAQTIFTASGTFVVPVGVNSITIEMVGAGGSGGGNGGGGGGGGGYAKGTFTVSPGTSYSIVVGVGGSELATIAGGLGILAGAGENGGSVPNPNIGGGGAGGVGLGGTVTRTGGAGGGGYWTYFGGGGGGAAGVTSNGGAGGNTIAYIPGQCDTPGGGGGISGGAPGGAGGKGAGFTDPNCTVSDPADDGTGYGAGGGGGNGIGSSPGVGGGGICIIIWDPVSGIGDHQTSSLMLLDNLLNDRIALQNVTGNEIYELHDSAGRILWYGAHIETQDFSHLCAGSYILKVTLGGTVRTFRMMKQAR